MDLIYSKDMVLSGCFDCRLSLRMKAPKSIFYIHRIIIAHWEITMFEMTDEEKIGRRPHLRLSNSMSFSKLLDEFIYIRKVL